MFELGGCVPPPDGGPPLPEPVPGAAEEEEEELAPVAEGAAGLIGQRGTGEGAFEETTVGPVDV